MSITHDVDFLVFKKIFSLSSTWSAGKTCDLALFTTIEIQES